MDSPASLLHGKKTANGTQPPPHASAAPALIVRETFGPIDTVTVLRKLFRPIRVV
jgi:hypothetical protein